MHGIIIVPIIVLLRMFSVRCAPKTYDLLRYSNVNIIRTVSKAEMSECTESGFNYECTPLDNTSDVFKEGIWKEAESWKAYFDEFTKEVKIEVNFNWAYLVNNFLLSFKEAKNISAVSIEIYSGSKVVHAVHYAASELLCEFFFPDDSSSSFCNIKSDLSEGVIIHYQEPAKGERVIIHLFPPIVNSYDKKHFYSINHVFIGGSCYCPQDNSLKCSIVNGNNFDMNYGTRYALVCAIDERQLIHDHNKKKRKRREACICSPNGTLYGLCNPFVGITLQCPCKQNYVGKSCEKCSTGYFGYPKCDLCNCDYVGSISTTCNDTTGQCKCEPRYSGLKCDRCAAGRYDFPFCYPCPCFKRRTKPSICHPVSGVCLCLDRYEGSKCSACKTGYEHFPICHRKGCECSEYGALDGTCNGDNSCKCKKNYAGRQCEKCAPGYGVYPKCKIIACDCDPFGSYNGTCNPKNGQCLCKPNYVGSKCSECARSHMAYPHCNGRDKCVCDTSGTRQAVRTEGACVLGHSCLCKKNVHGNNCSSCNLNSYNLSAGNPDGCMLCQCVEAGSFGNLATCDSKTGQCYCKPNVAGKTCNRCKDGFHLMDRWNLFGCTACHCDAGGSLSPNCDSRGRCTCKPNFEGLKCNRLKRGPYYVPSYYHNVFEVEEATIANKPVTYRYHSAEFTNFTGKGYFRFGQKQSNVKLELDVPKTRKYRILVRYFLKMEHETTMLVNLNSRDKETSYAAVVDFEAIDITIAAPNYALVLKSDGEKDFVLPKGLWDLEMSSISTYLLVDHIVLIPEEYFTGNILQSNYILPCAAGQEDMTCVMYQYLNLQKFQLIQAESGSNSKGYGKNPVKKTRLFEDAYFLEHLPLLGDMAELSRVQIALTLEVSVHTTDFYYLVITYLNPDERTYRLDMYDGDSGKRGQIEVVPCQYLFLCRLVIHQANGTPLPLKYFSNKISEITFLGNVRGSVAIDYVALIPVSKWSPDYIIPSKLCDKKNGVCLQNLEFQTPEDVIHVEPSDENPVNSLTNTLHVRSKKPVLFLAYGIKSDKYLLVYQFYQPNLPSFTLEVSVLFGGKSLKPPETVTVPHCPANSGCRRVLVELNARNDGMDGPVTIKILIPEGKELWIDSMFLIAESSFNEDILEPTRVELKQRFQRSCIDQNGLPLRKPPEGFCMQALITLTSQFTNKTFECSCDEQGSLSLQCDSIGGQCRCRLGAVSQNCSRCQTGFYNFPNCKPCNCFGPGSVNANCNEYGQCKCKPNYTGWSCNRCEKQQWGFPTCTPCECEARGSFGLACRRSDGQCSCLKNFGGRRCRQCQVGYFDFPECRSCNCNPAGIRITEDSPTGCFKFDRNRCDCKKHVEGDRCSVCKPHFFGLNVSNPLGCTPCNCSSFGTIRGAGPCNMVTGQCLCQPNVAGKDCAVCKDGFYVVKTDQVFKCQPCLCSPGGSINGVCDKFTGQCKCKPHIAGAKCDKFASDGYYLPSISRYVFEGQQISPSSPRAVIQGIDGAYVNSSYASARMDFEVSETQEYYLVISYALVKKRKAVIDLEFSNEVSFTYLTHKLKSKKLMKPIGEVIKEDTSYFKLNLTEGPWSMQALFQETIFLSLITLVPCEHFKPNSISRRIHNPCTIKDNQRFCSMYTYYDVTKTSDLVFEAESLAKGNIEYFDLDLYKGANINGAIALHQDEYLFTIKTISLVENYYVIVQYLHLESDKLTLEVSIRSNSSYAAQRGVAELFPCFYAFGCRQVALDVSNRKLTYQQINGEAFITLKVVSGKAAFIDFIWLVPVSKWSSHIITPEFYCIRRFSQCILAKFPGASNMMILKTKSSRGVSLINSAPPKSLPPSVSVLLSRFQRNLRWMTPMKAGGYYLIVHYYQPLGESFFSKIILTTFQRAVAAKINFKYCPSIYGCRTAALYLEENLMRRFMLSGNILRATFTLPFGAQVWIESLIFVNPGEYAKQKNFLEPNPLDLTKKYLRKCAGKQYKQVSKNVKSFCQAATFELKLRVGIVPKPCKCHPQGTVKSTQCNSYDGHCICRKGFLGRDCSLCVRGTFPNCKSHNTKT